MNPLFARSIHPKMSTNILDHVRTACCPSRSQVFKRWFKKSSDSTYKSNRWSLLLPTFRNDQWKSKERDQTIGLFLQLEWNPELQDPFRKRPIWPSFFFEQTQAKLHGLFPHTLPAVRISKKVPSSTLTQLDAELIICLFGQIIASLAADKNWPHSARVSLTTVAECGGSRW